MRFDVAVVGGGIVGGTLASALGQVGLRVAVVEARERDSAPLDGPFDLRVSALSRASERILRRLGVWERLPAERLGVFREMHVWEQGGSVHYDSADAGEPCLGWIVENRALVAALEGRIDALETVRWYRPARLEGLEPGAADARLVLDQGSVRARLVVAADGSRSRLRELAGISVRSGSYDQRAVVANVEVSEGHGETAWQRFLPTGPLAFLPLPGRVCAVVWSTSPEQADALVQASEAQFAARLEEAFEGRLGRVTAPGPRASFELGRLHASRYLGERVVLVGDAAHTIHPLAGQGANLGLLDAAALAQVVTLAEARGRDIGAGHNLRRYERWRRGHNGAVASAMSAFKWLFGVPGGPLGALRNLGLAATDRAAPLKGAIMRHASGLDGDLPELARPLRDIEGARDPA